MNPEYSVQIIWSREDGAYIATPFELPGCAADGQTPEEALKNLRVVIEEWVQVAKDEGREIPLPMSREDFERVRESMEQESKHRMQEQVCVAVNAVVGKIVEEMSRAGQERFLFGGGASFSRELQPVGFPKR